ncbi:hypothetical protein HSX11_08875 [Oxalobacteraceae bacterium]|nr:hypothetical protein [Oxalobacteraceae bacterium]
MIDYDTEYFFIQKEAFNEHLPSAMADVNTSMRKFEFEAQPLGSSPLIFFNAAKDRQISAKINEIVPDIIFDSGNFMVKKNIRDKLISYDFPNVSIHPAVYIDNKSNWHEDYWYLTFTSFFDCWDRSKSTYDSTQIKIGSELLFSVDSYGLNYGLLDATELKDRLFFKMGGTGDGLIVCHKSLAPLFQTGERCGANLTLISDY